MKVVVKCKDIRPRDNHIPLTETTMVVDGRNLVPPGTYKTTVNDDDNDNNFNSGNVRNDDDDDDDDAGSNDINNDDHDNNDNNNTGINLNYLSINWCKISSINSCTWQVRHDSQARIIWINPRPHRWTYCWWKKSCTTWDV